MVLKQIFTTGAESHTDIGNHYNLIHRDKVPSQFKLSAQDYFGAQCTEESYSDIEAFIHFEQGQNTPYKTIPCRRGTYNAIMSTNGHIYNVITLAD